MAKSSVQIFSSAAVKLLDRPRAGGAGGAGALLPMLGLTQLSNYLNWKGSFSAVSKPIFASKYALESSRRDLQNALLCTAFGIHLRKLGKKRPGQNNPEKEENEKTRGQ